MTLELAGQLAAFPQAYLRSDRPSALGQHDLDLPAAIRHELVLGAAIRPAAQAPASSMAPADMGRHCRR